MTVPADIKYPAIATNAAWQKKKSFIDKAKASTKTGLGDDLKKAEAAWNGIPWAELDAAKLKATDIQAAEANLTKAKAALAKVATANAALSIAKVDANHQATNKALSKTAQAAALAIFTALQGAQNRLATVKVTDFEHAIAQVVMQLSKISVKQGNIEVATGGYATWDHKVLKVAGFAWKTGNAATYKGKALTVSAKATDGAAFQNDMKFESASGSTATFKV